MRGVASLRRSLPGFHQNPKIGDNNARIHERLTKEHVEQLKQEPNLDTIFLTRGETKDDDLALLAGVSMKGLVIDSVHITDRGIKALEDHPTLESLGLWSSSITDRSLESIPHIRSLTRPKIEKVPITDEGVSRLIERLSEIGKLKSLSFFRCPNITNDGLRKIGQLNSLEGLFLNSNAGLASELLNEVAHLENLLRLEIGGVQLDEEDLAHLAALTKLETLALSNCRGSAVD